MLKRDITYTDFNDQERTETFYFNLSKVELVKLEVEFKEGFAAMMQRIIEEKDHKELVSKFQRIILMAYGKKSEDGKRFEKSPEISAEFEHHAAYDALFMELASDDGAGAEFMLGILPKDMVAENQEKLVEAASQSIAVDAASVDAAPTQPSQTP